MAALERWPESGVPENPGAWLMATAKNRAIDLARRGRRFEDRREQLIREAGMRMAMDAAEREAAAAGLGDDLLALIFACSAAAPSAPTPCRRRSPPANARAPSETRRRNGTESPPSTTPSPS